MGWTPLSLVGYWTGYWRIQTSARGPHQCRHSARQANLICFLVSHVYFFIGGEKPTAKLDRGHGRIFPPLDPPLGQTRPPGALCKIFNRKRNPQPKSLGTAALMNEMTDVYFFVGGEKPTAKLDRGHGRIFPPLDPPLGQTRPPGALCKIFNRKRNPQPKSLGTAALMNEMTDVYFFVGGEKPTAKLDRGHGRIFPPLDPPLGQTRPPGAQCKIFNRKRNP